MNHHLQHGHGKEASGRNSDRNGQHNDHPNADVNNNISSSSNNNSGSNREHGAGHGRATNGNMSSSSSSCSNTGDVVVVVGEETVRKREMRLLKNRYTFLSRIITGPPKIISLRSLFFFQLCFFLINLLSIMISLRS